MVTLDPEIFSFMDYGASDRALASGSNVAVMWPIVRCRVLMSSTSLICIKYNLLIRYHDVIMSLYVGDSQLLCAYCHNISRAKASYLN